MPTKAELLERIRVLEENNAALRELLEVTLPKVTALMANHKPGGALANKQKAVRVKAEMLEMYLAGRKRFGMNKTEARKFANNMEKILGFNKIHGYSDSWLIRHLKD